MKKPSSAVALAARVKIAGEEFIGDQQELFLIEEQPGEQAPYERLLSCRIDHLLEIRTKGIAAKYLVKDGRTGEHE